MSIEREIFLNTLCFGREVVYLNFVFSGKLLCYVVLVDQRHIEYSVFIKQVPITGYL